MYSPGCASGSSQRRTPASQQTWDVGTPFILFCASPGCHTCCARTQGLPSQQPPNSLGVSGVPGSKGWVLGASLRVWGRRKGNLCDALDGAANTQTPGCSIQRNLCSRWLLLPGVLGPDTSGSEAGQWICIHPGEKGGEDSGELIWMTWWVAPHTAWHICQGVCPVWR